MLKQHFCKYRVNCVGMNSAVGMQISVFVIVLSSISLHAAETSLEQQITAVAGYTVTLSCHTELNASVDWRYHSSPYEAPHVVFSNDKVYPSYRRRFRVLKPTVDDYSLTIDSVEKKDAGLYTCAEDGDLGPRHMISFLVTTATNQVESTQNASGTFEIFSTASGWATFLICAVAVEAAIIVLLLVKMRGLKRICEAKLKGQRSELKALVISQTSDAVIKGKLTKDPFVTQYPVVGVALLDEFIYIAYHKQGKLDVFNNRFNAPVTYFTVAGLSSPKDMTSCAKNHCLYVTDYMKDCVFRLNSKGWVIRQWPVAPDDTKVIDVDHPMGISVTKKCNVLITCSDTLKVREFNPEGRLLREVSLLDDTLHAWHSILLSSGDIVVCHGSTKNNDPDHRVYLLNADIEADVLYYGGPRGHDNDQLNVPRHMAVDKNGFIYVADMNNRRVLLFDPKLSCQGVVFERERPAARGDSRPDWRLFRLCLDENNNKLYVVGVVVNDDGPQNGCIMAIDVKTNGDGSSTVSSHD